MISSNILIENRNRQKISLILEQPKNPAGLAFVMHGMGGFKEQDHIAALAATCVEEHLITLRFDARNTLGESEGSYEQANITSYYQDLEDVIQWSQTQPWYHEPFILIGHSLGSICILLYAEQHPEKVKALAPLSTVISGTLALSHYPKEKIDEWNSTGWRISPSTSKPGVLKKLQWHQFVNDIQMYDILPNTDKLVMPILLVVGEQDTGTPLEDQQILYGHLPGNAKELHIIKGARHTFRTAAELQELQRIFRQWLIRYN